VRVSALNASPKPKMGSAGAASMCLKNMVSRFAKNEGTGYFLWDFTLFQVV